MMFQLGESVSMCDEEGRAAAMCFPLVGGGGHLPVPSPSPDISALSSSCYTVSETLFRFLTKYKVKK